MKIENNSNYDVKVDVAPLSKSDSEPKTIDQSIPKKEPDTSKETGTENVASLVSKLREDKAEAQQIRAFLETKLDNSDKLKASGATKPYNENQSAKPATNGAYYSKYETNPSKTDKGISSEGIIAPTVTTDSARYFINTAADKNDKTVSLLDMNDPKTGPLDRPSIYMGTSGGREVDAGMSWNRVFTNTDLDEDGKGDATWTTDVNGSSRADQYIITKKDGGYGVYDLQKKEFVAQSNEFSPNADGSVNIGDLTLRPNFAFRAFSRIDAGGSNPDKWSNPVPGSANDNYVYAQEKFDMSFTVSNNNFELSIKTAGGNTTLSDNIPDYQQGKINHTFKIVDSIDQRNTATKPSESSKTDKTETTVTDGSWGATRIIGNKGSEPFNTTNSNGVRPKEFSDKDYNLYNSEDKKGRKIKKDGSRPIYINPSRVK